ncbi:DNA polymerase I [Microbacterium trichothecenolyticum]|uniref:DNA polymerase I n=1 Tax=Microbacterium ureisolvens TaxID=2781186 RepID=A0ABS7HV58_9MICO|nr:MULTISPECIES: DNA polymerase I [Microbacterium]MBW9108680.1 DNA polymerase I [Microbacterium ureisolvens]MBW9119039.1 DNA polymerase I [Microbacterium trichothecenolyticum]
MTDSAKPTLLVVDGHSLAYRAFYALPVDNFSTKDGQHTNGIYGFLAMLINLIKAEKPTHLAVAFDTSRQSFRTREYTEYKANRSETPSEFKGQIPLLQDCLAAMSIQVLQQEDIEADDILATLATQGAAEGFQVLVCSGDRDTIQLVNDDITLLYPNVQGVSQLKRYDRQAVIDRYGVPPEQYPDIAALVGETSDNLPGVPKVGEKTAVKWLTQFGSLDALLEGADSIKGVVGGNLRDHLEDVRRNRRLNRLLTDVDLPVGPGDLEVQPMDAQAVRDIFSRLEFKTLIPRVAELAGIEQQMAAVTSAAAELAPVAEQLAPAEFAAWLERAPGELGVTVTVEGGLPARIGVATKDAAAEASWTPELAAAIEPWLTSDSPKILADAKPQVKALRRAGLRLGGLAFDVILAGWLLRPSFPDKNLAHLVDRYLDEKLPESDPTQLVPETEGATTGQLSWYLVRVAAAVRAELPDSVAAVLTDIELPTLHTLADMELAGVAVSHATLSQFSGELGARADALAQEAYAAIGREVNLGSPKQLQEVLFEELQLPKTRKTKTGYSTDAAVLADLQETNPHPFLDLLLQHREATKLRQIIESLDSAIGGDRASGADGRIHTTYVQTGSQTGRLSSTDPNLQNIPIRTEESRRIRSAFTVGEGYETLLTADYSQIEMRIMAHLSEDPGLIEAFNSGEDTHRFVGSRVFGVAPQDVTPAMRTKVKAMSYGLVYGLSAFGLSKQLRIEQAEAKQLMMEYFARFGAVRDYLRSSVEQARIDGYTETIFGRRRPFPDLASPNRVLRENAERAALNAPIQGSAADIMKIALFHIHDDFAAQRLASRVLLQIHDELVVEVAPGEWDAAERIVRSRMGDAAKLSVPLDVQIGRGDNWDVAGH